MKNTLIRTLFVSLIVAVGATLVHAEDIRPVPTKTPAPQLQGELKQISAKVAILVTISPAGEVSTAEIRKSTDDRLNEIALESVRRWKFEPAKKDGVPVECTVVIPMIFGT